MRISGFILFNPILGRRNIPAWVKGAFIICLAIFTYYYVPYTPVEIGTAGEYMVLLAKEALAGFAVGFIVNIFASIVIGACEIIDMQIGLGMAKMYDPQSNIQLGITANMFNALFILVFFAMGCHINMIKIFLESYNVMPYGNVVFFTNDIAKNMIIVAINSIEMCIRFALPIMAAELFLEMGVGLLMKAVPQINVFVVNIQLKLVLGMFLILSAIPMFTGYMSNVIGLMFSTIENFLRLMT